MKEGKVGAVVHTKGVHVMNFLHLFSRPFKVEKIVLNKKKCELSVGDVGD